MVAENKKTYKNPICEGADPFVLLHDGKYYLYATNAKDGFKVSESDDLINWTDRGYCLKKDDVIGEEYFWAPEVMYHNSKFYMIYTSSPHIGVAVSDSPLGPFKQKDKKWAIEKEAIDGHFFKDDDGEVYLYYRAWDTNNIAGAKMNPDMLTADEDNRKMLIFPAEYEWEMSNKDCIGSEGPFVIKHNGYYYLTYSCNDYRDVNYCVGCAVSNSPLGEYKKFDKPILRKSDELVGTGHHSFTTSKDAKTLICVYHCHNSLDKVHPRLACIDKAEFIPSEDGGADILVINGPTVWEMPALD